MPDQPGPNVARSLFAFHHLITRGLEVSRDNVRNFSRLGFPDDRTRDGFTKYVSSLATVIDSHHLVEDHQAFPYFKELFPDAPFENLSAEHQQMLPILANMRQAVQDMGDPQKEKDGFNGLTDALSNFMRIWEPHIRTEEQNLSPENLAEMLPPEEHLRLMREFAQFSQPHAQPAALVTPFMLFNLTPQERAAFAANMPPEVANHLVPVVWKAEWESMGPFLIEE
jgi:hemerythrin-like domain-containing protein